MNKGKALTKIIYVLAAILVCIVLIAFFRQEVIEKEKTKQEEEMENEYNIIGNTSTSSIYGETNNVEEFLKIAKDQKISLEGETQEKIFNITPRFVIENSDYEIFKDGVSAESYLLYDDNIYKIGEGKSGLGILSFALADMNKDEKHELYYTYQWRTGIDRSNVAMFDPSEKVQKGFDMVYYKDKNVILITKIGVLYLCDATFSKHEDVTNFKLNAGNVLSKVVSKNGNIYIEENQ